MNYVQKFEYRTLHKHTHNKGKLSGATNKHQVQTLKTRVHQFSSSKKSLFYKIHTSAVLLNITAWEECRASTKYMGM